MECEIAKRYLLCSNCSDRRLSGKCDGKCKEYWKYLGAKEQKRIDMNSQNTGNINVASKKHEGYARIYFSEGKYYLDDVIYSSEEDAKNAVKWGDSLTTIKIEWE